MAEGTSAVTAAYLHPQFFEPLPHRIRLPESETHLKKSAFFEPGVHECATGCNRFLTPLKEFLTKNLKLNLGLNSINSIKYFSFYFLNFPIQLIQLMVITIERIKNKKR